VNVPTWAGGSAAVVCFGEAIIDLVCERELTSLHEADCFRPHLGGALANVAVACRRAGAPAALLSGAGDDEWGRWLRDALEGEGVEMGRFALVAGAPTPLALVTFEPGGEPAFMVYGEGIARAMTAASEHLDAALAEAEALVFGSNTLVSEPERALTLRARELALDAGRPVLFDPNLRPTRWARLDDALRACRELFEGAFVVRTNRAEARLLTGEDDPADAAEAIRGLGARLAIVTLGPEGALMRGAADAKTPGMEVEVVSTLGAGDAFVGALAAGLRRLDWDAERAGEVLPSAVAASAEACTTWGAWA
jgi:sugar/nucleoside kinase (ribokinase family)